MENNKKSIKEVSAGELSINDQTELKIDNETSKKSMIELLEDETFVEILIRCNTDKEMKYLFAAKGCDINDEQIRKIKICFKEINNKLKNLNSQEIKNLNARLTSISNDELESISAGGDKGGIFGGVLGAGIGGGIGFITGLTTGIIDATHEMKDAKTTGAKAKAIGKVFLKAFVGTLIGSAGAAVGGAVSGKIIDAIEGY